MACPTRKDGLEIGLSSQHTEQDYDDIVEETVVESQDRKIGNLLVETGVKD